MNRLFMIRQSLHEGNSGKTETLVKSKSVSKYNRKGKPCGCHSGHHARSRPMGVRFNRPEHFTESYYSMPKQAATTVDWCAMRHTIIRTVEEEQGFWLKKNSNDLMSESNSKVLEMLEKYWKVGVGRSNYKAMAKGSSGDKDGFAWSAAFVSWVMKNAGVTRDMGFKFSGQHMVYIEECIRNREVDKLTDRAFKFYGIGEQDHAIAEPGDLVCLNRKYKKGTSWLWTDHTYDKIKKGTFKDGSRNSHCDVVKSYITRGKKRFIEVVGGNVGNTVGSKEFEVNARGEILNPATHHIFGIVKLLECQDPNL